VEYASIVQSVEEERALQHTQHASYWDLFSRDELMWYRTMVGFMVQLLQQFTGINAVMYVVVVVGGGGGGGV